MRKRDKDRNKGRQGQKEKQIESQREVRWLRQTETDRHKDTVRVTESRAEED